jgi:hypothetical protein
MFNINKEMKKLENQQKAQEQLNTLSATLKSIEKMIDEFAEDARNCLINNDQAGYELIANSIYYFMDIQKVVQTVKVQFQTYIKTAQFMDTIEGLRPVLKNTAQLMNSMPSLEKNNRDFMKFRKSLMRGQLNMRAMTSMMTNINPATQTSRSREELDALKERLLLGANRPLTGLNVDVAANTATSENTSRIAANEDFFSAIND